MVSVAPAATTPGQRADPPQRLVGEGAPRVVVGVAASAGARPRPSSTRSATKPGSTSQHAREAREQQPGAEQQHEGEGHLGHDQRAAQARARRGRRSSLRPSSRSTPLGFARERARERHEAHHDPDREREDERVERRQLASRPISRPVRAGPGGRGAEAARRAAAPSSRPAPAATSGQQHALHHELARELPGPRAEREPRGQLLEPRARRARARGWRR